MLSCSATLLIGFAITPAAVAHEMFLKPELHRLAPASAATIELVNGTFDRSDNVIDRDRMRDVRVHGGGATLRPSPDQWFEREKSTLLRFATGAAGTYAVGVSTKPRMITLSATAFADYLRHEGVADALAEFETHGGLEEVRERYSKHVRTIIRVGEKASDEHQTVFGYPVEIILDADPYAADMGDAIGFQVFANGEPLADQLVLRVARGDGDVRGGVGMLSRHRAASHNFTQAPSVHPSLDAFAIRAKSR